MQPLAGRIAFLGFISVFDCVFSLYPRHDLVRLCSAEAMLEYNEKGKSPGKCQVWEYSSVNQRMGMIAGDGIHQRRGRDIIWLQPQKTRMQVDLWIWSMTLTTPKKIFAVLLSLFSPTHTHTHSTDSSTCAIWWKSGTEAQVGDTRWDKVGSPVNVNYGALSWSKVNFKYRLYSGTVALS